MKTQNQKLNFRKEEKMKNLNLEIISIALYFSVTFAGFITALSIAVK